MNAGADPAPGVVELREDVPLKAGAGGSSVGSACCAGGPRLIIACFAVLTAAITLALFTQIYYGDYEVVPHGGVASDAAVCSSAGTDALKAGGRALDAAAAAALCLAVLAPHRTSLHASGSLLYWEYRQARSQLPALVEWDGDGDGTEGPPRLLAALVALHAQHGALPWPRVLQPAIDLAKNGFVVSESLAAALAERARGALPPDPQAPAPTPGELSTAPELAAYLESLQSNTSAELSTAWGSESILSRSTPTPSAVGAWRLLVGGPGAAPVRRALALALLPPPRDADDASERVVSALRAEIAAGAGAGSAWPPAPGGVASGLAAVDSFDTYVALVTGLAAPFASGGGERADVAPALLLEARVCGTRYVLGGGAGAALAQAAAALAAGGGTASVERARAALLPGSAAAVNVVQQSADALLTHADSRGGGLASRF